MKYLRRNQDEPQPDLKQSMVDFKKQRFGNSRIGAGLTKLPEFRQATTVTSGGQGTKNKETSGAMIKPLITRADLAFLNDHGNETDFPLSQPSAAAMQMQ